MRLVMVLVLVASFLLPTQASADGGAVLTYDEAVALLRRVDAVYDQIGAEETPGIRSLAEAQAIVREVLPFFEYEGISLFLVYPRSIAFRYYETGREHNHVLGTTQCLTTDITLNARFVNPQSAWYGRIDSIGTLVHELAHAQGICFSDRLDAEASAQLVTLEVLAALANKGNNRMFAALVSELRDMLWRAVEYAATAEGRQEEFAALEVEIATDAFELASLAKSRRYWTADQETLQTILRSYNYVPIAELIAAWRTDREIDGVKLPINAYCGVPPAGMGETQSCEKRPLVADDVTYVLDHLEELGSNFW